MTKERFAKVGKACRASTWRGRGDEKRRRAGAQGIMAGGSKMCITNR
mgnify:CR=1